MCAKSNDGITDSFAEYAAFLPWIGQRYEAGYRDGLKLLVLGESHYLKETDERPKYPENYTRETIQGFIESRDTYPPHAGGFAGYLHRLLSGRDQPTSLHAEQAWSRVAYANFIPMFVGGEGASSKKTPSHWRVARKQFPALMKQLNPDRVLVLGFTNFGEIRHGEWYGREGMNWMGRGLWKFDVGDNGALATCIYHPSLWRELERSREVLDALLDVR